MNNNYDSVEACITEASTHSQKQEGTSYTATKRNWLSFVTVFIALFCFSISQGQSSANYAFSTNTTGSLAADANGNVLDMTTGTTQLVAPLSDATASSVTNIGFNYYFMGNLFSQFSVNADGVLGLGTTAISGTTVSGGSVTTPKISALCADLYVSASGKVHYKLVGTAPNRCLVVEWTGMAVTYNTTALNGNSTWQVRLYEGSGLLEYVYGSINCTNTLYNPVGAGFSVASTANNTASITYSTNAVSNGATFNTNTLALGDVPNLNSTANGSRRVYKFTPPTPASGPTALNFSAITSTTTTLNWTAPTSTAGLVKYIVMNSTNGGSTFNFVANVALGTNTYAATALIPGTTYLWKVVAINEGVESTPASGTQATSAAATYYWVGTTGGNWNTPANWNTAADNTGTTRATVATTDILIVDGDGTTAGGSTTINVDLASFTIGQFKVTSNTNVILQSSVAATTRTITISGSPGDDFVVENGSTLNLNSIIFPVAFAFTGTGNTGLVSGTINFAGSTSNVITTTGGTGTLVTVASTGVVNLGAAANSLVGSVATLTFANGSNCNSTGATTGAPPIPLATWGASSNLTITGITTSTTGPTNNNQSFGNFTYNSTTSTATMSVFTSTTTAVIQGNLTINATNRGRFRATTSGTLTVNGNLIINAGTFEVASTSGTVKVLGNVIQNGGRLDITSGSSTASLLVAGQFNQVSGDLLVSGTSTTNKIEFNGTSVQNVTFSGTTTTGPVVYRVNNAAGINLTGTLNVNAKGGVIISSGNIAGSGSIVYTSSHNYTSAAGANNTYVSAAGATNTYVSAAGATSNSTLITVASTAGLQPGMTVTVTAGTGVFAASTTVSAIFSATTFTVSAAPTTALSGGATVVSATGGTTINVQSTDGLQPGMTVTVTSGTGVFAASTTVSAIVSPTSFTVSAAPTTALSGGATVVTATGGTTVNVQSTLGLQAGMTVTVSSGAGVFAANTTVSAITSSTTFTVSAAPTTALSGGTSVVSGTFIGANVLTYNGAVAQTANVLEFPSTNGPGSLTINNTATAPNNVVTVPFTRTLAGTAGALTLTAGILDNSTYLLSVPNTAVAAVSGGSATSFVKGALARNLQASQLTGSTFTFPVGKSGYNPFVLVNPTTNAGGTVTVQSEVFDTTTGGTAGNLLGSLSTNRYWAASITSGSANFTNTLIRLTDAPNGADAIGGSSTLTGAYGLVGGLTATSTPTSLTTTTPEATSILGFYVMGLKATPTLSNLAITPIGNRCPNVTRTVSVTVAPGAGAITGVVINYSVNGTAQTAIAMTNTSGNDWTGVIPTVTPANAAVTWSVTATDVNLLTKTQTGTPYTDGGLNSEIITITPSVPNFCGTGGDVTLVASSSITGVTYTWTALTSSAVLPITTGASVTATISQTSDFKVTGTPNDGGCPSEKYVSVGVYPLPTATVTTTASGVCPGTSATINSGLSAGNFLSLSITPGLRTAPANAVTICTAGVGTPAPVGTSGTSYDDGGWANLPIGFNFNFFGTNYSTVNAGTNGNLMFGTFNATALADFTFTTLPSTTEPLNMVALLAMDNDLAGATGGTVKYWTEGYSPNRKFIISYENVKEYGDTKFSTFQGVFYETTGVIEVHVASSTNVDRNKVTGVNNGDGTIGVLAYASGTSATSTNPIASPFAYRFTPPANYTTTWTATDANGTTTIATGTNIFSQSVAPAITTTYSISYTNQTTGCTNAAGSAQVVMSVLGSVAPSGVNTIASATTICSGNSVNLSMDYTGSTDGLAFQWQSSVDNGATWQDITLATAITTSVVPTIASQYRCKIVSCGGTPGYSSVVSVTFVNGITSTTPASRCGVGTASIQATANAGATINWYTAETGGTSVGTGSPFVTPQLSATTTYYASAETTTNATIALGSTATIDTGLTTSSTDGGMVFTTTTNNVKINSIDVLVSGTGDLTIKLQDASGVDIASTTVTAFSGSSTALTNIALPTSFVVPTAGTGYRLICSSLGTGLTWYYQTGAYPFTTSGVSITGGYGWSSATSYATDLRFVHKMNLTVPTVCASPRVAVPVTFTAAPTFTLTSNAATICSGVASSAVTVSSTVSDFDSYVWTPSTGVSGNETIGWTFNPLTSTTYTLAVNQTAGSLCSNSASFVVTANALPTVATVAPVAVCSPNTVDLTASAVTTGSSTGLTYTYFSDASATTAVVNPSAIATSGTYYVKGTNANGCSQIASVVVTINSLPTVATVTPAAVCSPTTIDLTASAVTTGSDTGLTYTYWTNAGATTALTNSTAVATSGTYYIKGTNANGCSSVASVVVTVNPLPTVTTLAPATVCYPSTVDLTASAVTTGSDSGLTYTYFTDLAATTSYATPTAAVAGTYYIKGINANGCSSIASLVVSVNQPAAPTGSTTADFCGTANMTNLSAVGSGIKWYDAATAGNQIPVLSVIGLTTGTTYYATQTVAGCESVNRLPVAVTIIAIPSAPNASSQTFCNSGTVADLAPSGSGLQWYDVATNGTALTSATPLATGTYFVSQTSFMCEGPRTSVSVTVNTTGLPTASAQTFCASATVADLVATGTAIKWYAAATGGSALASTATLSTTNYYASQTINGCEGSRIQVPVTVNTTAVPSASAQTFCTSATVADLVATGAGLQWYVASNGGSALASTASIATGTYYVSQTLNTCESLRLPVNVTITTASTPTGASPQAIFGGVAADATIEDISVSGTNVIWYPTALDAAAGTNAIVAGTQITNGSTYYAVSVVGSCRSNALAVTVTVTLDRGTFDVANFSYYPNPTSDVVNISYADEITRVRVFNMLGQEVITKQVNATTAQIDLSQFASGTYFVEVTADEVSKTVKVIKK